MIPPSIPDGTPPMPSYPTPGQPVPNYLVQAILTTVLCCPPFGIVSIVYAAQVNGKVAANDYAGAMASSKNAKMWAWIAFGLGLVMIIIYAAMILPVVLSAMHHIPQPAPGN